MPEKCDTCKHSTVKVDETPLKRMEEPYCEALGMTTGIYAGIVCPCRGKSYEKRPDVV